MPATPQLILFSEDDFKERLNYSELEGDYEATLVDVTDIKASTTDNFGWGFEFQVKGLKLTSRVWLKGGGAWKVRQVFNALGQPVPPNADTKNLNPNPLIGRSCVVTIAQKPYSDGSTNEDGTPKTFADIVNHTPIVRHEDVADFSEL